MKKTRIQKFKLGSVPSIDQVSIRGWNVSQWALTQGYEDLITTLTLPQKSLMWPLQPQHSHSLWMDRFSMTCWNQELCVEKMDHSCMRECAWKSRDMCQLMPAITDTEAEVKIRWQFMEIMSFCCKTHLQDVRSYQFYTVKVQLNKIVTEQDIWEAFVMEMMS